MGRKPTGRTVGRPPKEFDPEIFEGLCHLVCTWEEIESVLRADRNTINAWCKRTFGADFSTVYKKFSAAGKIAVRRNQFHLSKTNATMAIWLGKQWLGQKDDPPSAHEFNGTLKAYIDTLKRDVKEKYAAQFGMTPTSEAKASGDQDLTISSYP